MKITCTLDTTTHKVVPIELINAIEKLVKCRGRYHTQQNFELLQSAFAKHQAAPPYPADTNIVETLDSWIPCSERLPAPYTEVMVWPYPTDYTMTAQIDSKKTWSYDQYISGYGNETYKTESITHWMTLPAAPKGK